MAKPASIQKKPRKHYTPEFRNEALKFAERIGVAAAACELNRWHQGVGFSMVLQDKCCLFAAFMLPEDENKGIGHGLLMEAEEELFKHHEVIWLETEKYRRAAKFY